MSKETFYICCLFMFTAVAHHLDVHNPDTMSNAVATCKDEGIEIEFDEEILDELNITNGLWVGIKKIHYRSYRDHNDTEVDIRNGNEKGCMFLTASGSESRHKTSNCFTNDMGVLCSPIYCKGCQDGDCIKQEDKCFYFRCGLRNWYEAREFCTRRSTRMLSVNSTEPVQPVLNKIKLCKEIWLYFHKEDWIYQQSKHSIASSKWALDASGSDQNDKCAIIVRREGTWRWKPVSCTEEHSYICRKIERFYSTTTMIMNTDTTFDMTTTQSDLIETTHSGTTAQDKKEIPSTIIPQSVKKTKNLNWYYWIGALLLLLTIALTVGLTMLILKCKSRRHHRQSHAGKGAAREHGDADQNKELIPGQRKDSAALSTSRQDSHTYETINDENTYENATTSDDYEIPLKDTLQDSNSIKEEVVF